MALEKKIKKAYESLKAPEGKFVVCVWNPSNTNKSVPEVDGWPYLLFEKAVEYAKTMNEKEQSRDIRERAVVGPDLEYFVVDDKGYRVN